MFALPVKLQLKLKQREENNALRTLRPIPDLIDFSSNDYLGLAKNQQIFSQAKAILEGQNGNINGAAGSRLLTGNYELLELVEPELAKYHQCESALLFNSGYDANVGFFSSVPQRNDIILYDELCHASIRDGIGLSLAKSYKFEHNSADELRALLEKFSVNEHDVYVVTESVFSMDGDSPFLEELVQICSEFGAFPIIDEAHALGVFGDDGLGLVQQLNLQNSFFARIMTFGKGLGCHGAVIVGSTDLKSYLVNFSRSLIYTTAMPPHNAATILSAYRYLIQNESERQNLLENIVHFNQEKFRLGIKPIFVYSKSAIQCAIIPGNEKVRKISNQLQQKGFDVRPILSPTVPLGQERLRICLHAFNSKSEISQLLETLSQIVFQD